MANTYDIGDVVRCSAAFTDADGAAADPTTLTFRWQTPAGVEASYVYGTDDELVKDGTGNYHVDLTIDNDGVWYHRFEGTGTNVAAAESYFVIQQSEFY